MVDRQRIKRDLTARASAAKDAVKGFAQTIAESDDAEEIIGAARRYLESSGELKAIDLALREIDNIGAAEAVGEEYRMGLGSSGRAEALRRFGKKA